MKFKVTLARSRLYEGNPFRAGAINETHQTDLRVWEIEAGSEAQVQQFYDEAKAKNMPNVMSFELRSIEPVNQQPAGQE